MFELQPMLHRPKTFERHKVLIKLPNGSSLPNPLIRSLDSSIQDLIKMIRLECSVRQIFPQIEQTNFILQIDSTECVRKKSPKINMMTLSFPNKGRRAFEGYKNILR